MDALTNQSDGFRGKRGNGARIANALTVLIALGAAVLTTHGQASTPEEPMVEWEKRQNAQSRLRAYGTDLLGDGIDPHTGSISFEQTDVSIPGNSHLEVSIRRKISQGEFYSRSENVEFGDWQLDVPRIHITHLPGDFSGNRCSDRFNTSLPPYSTWQGATTINAEYSQGLILEAPGASGTQILEYTQPNPRWPSAATHVTTNGWWFTCITAADGSEGFEGHAPNGDIYRFDRVIVRDAPSLGGTAGSFISRKRTVLAARTVTDVNGYQVAYFYDSGDRLRRIQSNDGRLITLAYAVASRTVTAVNANGRIWRYAYSPTSFSNPNWIANYNASTRMTLDRVIRPDAREWTYNLDAMQAQPGPGANCIQVNGTLSVTHPAGVRGEFELVETIHRQSHSALTRIANHCPTEPPGGGNVDPPVDATYMETMAVVKKTLAGPGIDGYDWTFAYEREANGTPGSSNTLCASEATDPATECTNWTSVTEPDGRHITYYHLWNGENLGGKLLRMEIRQDNASGEVLETKDVAYLLEGSVGTSFARFGPSPATTLAPAHTEETVITRAQDTFRTKNTYVTNPAASNYSWGRPTKVVRSTSLTGVQRVVDTTYEHNKPVWVLGLTDTVTRNGKLFDDFGYDSKGRVVVHKRFGTTPDHVWREYDYFSGGQHPGKLAKVTDALGHETELSDYWRGIPRELIRPDDVSLARTVDNNGWVTSSTDAQGNTTEFRYNDMGWLTRVLPQSGVTPTVDTIISYVFNADGVEQTMSQSNLETTVQYDGMLRATLETLRDTSHPLSTRHMRTEYDSQGRPTFTSFPSATAAAVDGMVTEYDALGRPTLSRQNVAPFAQTTTEYLPGYQVRVTDPRGHATTTHWLAFGEPASAGPQSQSDEAPAWERDVPIRVDAPLGADQISTYDIYGNLDTTAAGSAVTDRDYDSGNRLWRVTDPDNDVSFTYYDANDRALVTEDGEGRRTRMVYDALGRVGKVIRAWAGNNDGTGATLDCDQMRIDTASDPTLLQQCYRETAYTLNGQIDWVQDANRNRTKYSYDQLNQPRHTYFPSSTTPGAHSTSDYERLTYNALGQVTQKRTRRGDTIHYTNDALGRLLDRRVPGAPTHSANGRTVSHSFTHDAWGHVRGGTHDGQTIIYDYDGIGRVISQTYAGSKKVSYEWDDANNLKKLTWPDGFAIDYVWDANNRIDLANLGSRTLADVDYDALSRRSRVTYANGTSVNADWSLRGDLERHDHTFANASLDFGFTYNGVGQMRSRSLSDPSYGWDAVTDTTNTYQVNGLNQYTSMQGASPSYDGNGNMSSDGRGRGFTHDAENVLRTATGLPGGTATYRYHADGARRQKNHGGASSVHYYIGGLGYLDDEDTAFAADQEIAEYTGAGALVRRFVRLPGSIDESFLMIDVSSGSPVETWAHMDRQGSVIATTNSAGNVVDQYRYSPYGKPGSEGVGGFAFRYTGQRLDAETGLYYYKARYYDPKIGRFLQTDPIGYEDQMNLYAYVGNDPSNTTDPSGEFAWLIPIAVCLATPICGGAVGGAIGGISGAVTSEDGDRVSGALKGSVTGAVAGSTKNAAATVATASALGMVDGSIEGATDNDPNTTALGSGLAQGAADGLAALTGVGASKLGQDELQEKVLSTMGSAASANLSSPDLIGDAAQAVADRISEIPLYPNAHGVAPPRSKPIEPSSYIRCPTNFNQRRGC